MVRINLAHTARINPEGVTPVLNESQIWQGLQRKIRFAQEFVPMIETCEVLEDKDGVVRRVATFKPGTGPKDKAEEVVKSYWPSWVDFHQEDGTVIKNIISNGDSGEEKDLQMTYAFEFNFTHIQEGTPEAQEQVKKCRANAKIAVEKSIETIRQMVQDGRIEK